MGKPKIFFFPGLRQVRGRVCHTNAKKYRAVVRQLSPQSVLGPEKLASERVLHQSPRHLASENDVIDEAGESLGITAVLKCLALGGIDQIRILRLGIVDLG